MSVTDCCGAPAYDWGREDGAREAFCCECDEQVCSACAATFEEDGEYLPDGGMRGSVYAICKSCGAK